VTDIWDEEAEAAGFVVVVTAGRSSDVGADHLEAALDWQDALVAVATAVIERGGRVIVPANDELAQLVATIGLSHAHPHAAEQRSSGAGVEVVETGGFSETARLALAPFAHRNAITYRDVEDRPVDLPGLSPEGESFPPPAGPTQHHPLTSAMIDAPGLLGVIVVGNTGELDREMRLLRSIGLPHVAVLASSPAGEMAEWAMEHDPTIRIMSATEEAERGPDIEMSAREEAQPSPDIGPVPYGTVVESLIEAWLREYREAGP